MFLPRSSAWLLSLLALCAITPFANAAAPHKGSKSSPQAAKPVAIALLAGAWRFDLPPGYQAAPLSPGDASTGTAGAQGTLYMNEAEKRIVVATEIPLQSDVSADDAFLSQASEGFVSRQAQGLPDFHKTAEKRISLGALPAEQIDATASIGGGKTLTTYFITGAGKQMAVVQVISRESDRLGHEGVVKAVTARGK